MSLVRLRSPFMLPRRLLLLGLVLLSTACASAPPLPASRSNASVTFERLRALVGDWEASTPKGAKVHASYRLVAADSALVETFTPPSGKETLTVFHLDGSRVIATHYCAQKNQPRLSLEASASASHFEFVFFDATNLPDPRASHLRRLLIDLVDSDHFGKTEIYEENGEDDVTVLPFHRTIDAR